MKLFIILAAVLGLTLAYTTDDDFDSDPKYVDQKFLCATIDCFLGDATCDPDSEAFKQFVQGAFNSGCSTCSPAQKHSLKAFFSNAELNCPTRTQLFLQKYDPVGNLRYSFMNAVKDS